MWTGAEKRPKAAEYFKDEFAAGGDMAQVPEPESEPYPRPTRKAPQTGLRFSAFIPEVPTAKCRFCYVKILSDLFTLELKFPYD